MTYLAAVDVRKLNLIAASVALRSWLSSAPPFDAVLLYNLEWYFAKPVFDHAQAVGVPVVVEYEDDATTVIGAGLKGWHIRRGQRSVRVARELAAGVVGVSPELVQQIGCANSVVVPGVVGDDLLRSERRAPARNGRLRVVYAGGLWVEKGPDLLVAAAGILGDEVEVDIIGTGPELESLRAAARRDGSRVRVHGEVDRAALRQLMERAEVAVNAQKLTNATVGKIFPFKILDYVGAGLPVVTSMLGEVPRPIAPCLVSYERNDANALVDAIRDARSRLSELSVRAAEARQWVIEEYSGTAAARKVEGVLLRAVESQRRMRNTAAAS